MKYTFECTEQETIANLRILEKVVDGVFAWAADLRSLDLRAATSAAKSEWHIASPTEPTSETPHEDKPTSADSKYADLDFGSSVPPAQPAKVEDWYDVPPEYKNIKPPIYLPDTDGEGETLFSEFVDQWSVNLGVEGTEQPDRSTMMQELGKHPKMLQLLGHVSACGGLTNAVAVYLTRQGHNFNAEYKERVNLIATTLCQISSLMFSDLAQMYEHRDIFKGRSV